MSLSVPGEDGPVYDLIGVGFGPSNLALAIALTEHNAAVPRVEPVTAHFFEQQPRFGWHRGMLIEDATMQVSFLKDLVTMRNPASEFSFLSYLHARGRLVDFINHKNLFPLRIEFHDYFEWSAAKVDDLVSYGSQVIGVEPVISGDHVDFFDVRVRTANGEETDFRARNLAIGTGLRPQLPEGVVRSDRIWHNHELLHRVDGLADLDPGRFVVVGAGQSAAEVTAFLHDRFPRAEVCSVFARYGYSPSDDSSFANRIFDPEAVDHFYTAPDAVKQRLLGYHANTNYSAVDIDLIDELYRRMYREKVTGAQRLRMFNVSRPLEVVETPAGVRTTIEELTTGERTVLDADVVVYATGYRPADPLPVLGELGQRCARDGQGNVLVERDYRLRTDDRIRAGIYLQGGTEHTHGITSSLLSNTAVRVGEILDSVVARRATLPAPEYAVIGAGSR
ncbi:lysine N(6)-hydroxylase/L-ornithine N(5)-oxygenase family protein [Amycolatopsis suaedae]|uniref:L-lysine N6-monooxygenase MbtG n=1 Tax=Amycolatopsis suaedae TaxID=2510978 RepID=A0A4Q7JBN0_9PSEU|nr:lysine N(6)-hydroxylase/L-ornithine N(5)-oxygenase family protein [Amycolatopsis suaedae]RZQ64697.1 L-lysine 6-monooxygenase [Amycolatopsis suaedae]